VLTPKYLLFAKKIAPGNIESAISQILFWCASLDFTFDTTSSDSHVVPFISLTGHGSH